MGDEMKNETVDQVISAIDKHLDNFEAASRAIKEAMDKQFGPTWHVIVGEGFGFQITHQKDCMMYMYYQGHIGILVYKC
jgi:dynein axonemal light chain 4